MSYKTEPMRRTVSVCEHCGETGPYAETHALVAVLNGDLEHAEELAAELTSTEARQLVDATVDLARLAHERTG